MAPASDSRTLHDGINTGWAGANSNAAVSNVSGSQEVILTTSGGLGEAETGGLVLNVIPRDGGNQFSGTMFFSGANGGMQGSNYTDELRAAGLRSPQELKKVLEVHASTSPARKSGVGEYTHAREDGRRGANDPTAGPGPRR